MCDKPLALVCCANSLIFEQAFQRDHSLGFLGFGSRDFRAGQPKLEHPLVNSLSGAPDHIGDGLVGKILFDKLIPEPILVGDFRILAGQVIFAAFSWFDVMFSAYIVDTGQCQVESGGGFFGGQFIADNRIYYGFVSVFWFEFCRHMKRALFLWLRSNGNIHIPGFVVDPMVGPKSNRHRDDYANHQMRLYIVDTTVSSSISKSKSCRQTSFSVIMIGMFGIPLSSQYFT